MCKVGFGAQRDAQIAPGNVLLHSQPDYLDTLEEMINTLIQRHLWRISEKTSWDAFGSDNDTTGFSKSFIVEHPISGARCAPIPLQTPRVLQKAGMHQLWKAFPHYSLTWNEQSPTSVHSPNQDSPTFCWITFQNRCKQIKICSPGKSVHLFCLRQIINVQ